VAHEPDADEADAFLHVRFLLQIGDLFVAHVATFRRSNPTQAIVFEARCD
jgi:hypothetical protein